MSPEYLAAAAEVKAAAADEKRARKAARRTFDPDLLAELGQATVRLAAAQQAVRDLTCPVCFEELHRSTPDPASGVVATRCIECGYEDIA